MPAQHGQLSTGQWYTGGNPSTAPSAATQWWGGLQGWSPEQMGVMESGGTLHGAHFDPAKGANSGWMQVGGQWVPDRFAGAADPLAAYGADERARSAASVDYANRLNAQLFALTAQGMPFNDALAQAQRNVGQHPNFGFGGGGGMSQAYAASAPGASAVGRFRGKQPGAQPDVQQALQPQGLAGYQPTATFNPPVTQQLPTAFAGYHKQLPQVGLNSPGTFGQTEGIDTRRLRYGFRV